MNKAAWILRYLSRCSLLYTVAFTLLLISIVTSIGITWIQQFIIDDVFMNRQYDKLTPYVGMFCAIAFTFLFSWVMKDILFERVNTRMRILLRHDYLRSLLNMPIKKYQNERIGGMISRINDLLNTSHIFAYQIPSGFENIVNLIILAGIIGFSSPYLLLILLVLCVFYIRFGKYFLPREKALEQQLQEKRSAFTVDIEEGISSTREVIAFHRERWEQEKIGRTFADYYQKLLDKVKIRNKQLMIVDPIKWAANLVILGYGGFSVLNDALSIGHFVVIYQFSNLLMQSAQKVYDFVLGVNESYVAVVRANDLIMEQSTEDGKEPLVGTIQSISVKQVSFGYNDKSGFVLHELDMDLPVGSKIALVGSSGGGKTTLGQLLAKLYEPDTGDVFINDLPLRKIDRQDFARRVSIVFQEPFLLSETIASNIDMGRGYAADQIEAACRVAEIHETIVGLSSGYETVIGERGITLSGGQRQRIAIARAIIGNPDVLILDEATSALDQQTERKVQENLDQLREGKTTVIIAHRLSTIRNSDKIFVIEGGHVAESGTHQELMDLHGKYSELLKERHAI